MIKKEIRDKERQRYGHKPREIYDKYAKQRFYTLKARAKRKNEILFFAAREFEIWFLSQPLLCHYCGVKLVKETSLKGQSPFDLTVDRRDNNIGYKIGNLVLACKRCNLVKNDVFTEQEMMEIAIKYKLKDR